MKVKDLMPGLRIHQGSQSAVFIATTPHPLYLSLKLVIWKMDDGEWSLDALSAEQYIGEAEPASGPERRANLERALLGGR